ncbi:MAG: hypothetical protein LUG99_00570 [Lachnospiraceae bacterium]|nr:hypothetical protein [Lachnospiraceae bacterium]
METPVNHWEHKELEKLVDAKVEALQAEDRRLNERLKIVEQQSKQISEIAVAVQKQSDNLSAQAKNIDSICKVQEQESDRLKDLESKRVSDESILKNLEELNGWRKDVEAEDGKKWRSFIKQAASFGIGILSALSIAYIRAQLGF